jgi:hypothetical protein
MSQSGRNSMRKDIAMFAIGLIAFLIIFTAAIGFFGYRQFSG